MRAWVKYGPTYACQGCGAKPVFRSNHKQPLGCLEQHGYALERLDAREKQLEGRVFLLEKSAEKLAATDLADRVETVERTNGLQQSVLEGLYRKIDALELKLEKSAGWERWVSEWVSHYEAAVETPRPKEKRKR